jgi:hypothetical protein
MQDASPPTSYSTRIGVASLAALIGLAVGLCLALVALAFSSQAISFAQWVFGASALFGVFGFVLPELALVVAEGAVHFFFGVVLGVALIGDDRLPTPERAVPVWLKLAFQVGLVLGIVFVFVIAA